MIEICAFDREQNEFVTQEIDDAKEERKMKFEIGEKVSTRYGEGEIVGILKYTRHNDPYLVRIFNTGRQVWLEENEIKSINKNKQKDDDSVVDKFDKVGNVVEKMVPVVSYIFLASLMSIFVICVALMILGACGIITVNYTVLGLISACLFLLIIVIAFAIITE